VSAALESAGAKIAKAMEYHRAFEYCVAVVRSSAGRTPSRRRKRCVV
jgi:hypothetical protein